jgi:hypothetical protein
MPRTKITVVFYKVGEAPVERKVHRDGKIWQELIGGGVIEHVTTANGLVVVCDDAGKLNKLPANCFGYVGDFVVTRWAGGKEVSLKPEQVQRLLSGGVP